MCKRNGLLFTVLLLFVTLNFCNKSGDAPNKSQYIPYSDIGGVEGKNSINSHFLPLGSFKMYYPKTGITVDDSGMEEIIIELEKYIAAQSAINGSLTEPKISTGVLKKLTTCPVPNLNVTKPTITSNVEWQIFVYCVLDILPTDSSGNVVYPQISKMDTKESAFTFMEQAREAYKTKYSPESNVKNLTQNQQFALFERFFLVTKFRKLTDTEKSLAQKIIDRKGINFLTKACMINWVASDFYSKYFDYSKNKSPAYGSRTLSGIVQDNAGTLIEGVNYNMATVNTYGFHSSGITKNSLLNTIGSVLGITSGKNFNVQFYQVVGAEQDDSKNKTQTGDSHADKNITSQNENGSRDSSVSKNDDIKQKESDDKDNNNFKPSTIAMVFRNPAYNIKVSQFTLNAPDTNGVQVTLEKIMVSSPAPASWPDSGRNVNNPFLAINWTPNIGGNVNGCISPDQGNSGVVQGHNWQKFSYCILQFNANNTQYGINYYPLVTRKSAFDFAFLTKEKYKQSDLAIDFTDLQLMISMYQFLTFKSPSATDVSLMNSAISQLGIEGALNQLFESWYISPAYHVYYDYSKESFEGKTWYHFSGNISQESNGSPLANVKIEVIDSFQQKLQQDLLVLQQQMYALPVSTDSSGNYSLPLLLDNKKEKSLLLFQITNENYAQTGRYVFPDNGTEQVVSFTMIPMGVASTTKGGQAVSPSENLHVDFPIGAVTSNISFSMTDLQIVQDTTGQIGTTAEFQITPGYQFQIPVKITVKITNDLIASLNSPGDNLALFVKENGQLKLLEDSVYNPKLQTLSATTTHFSTFVIGQCGIIDCIGPTMVDPMASVLERQHIEYPTQFPQLKREAHNVLASGGWNTSVVDNISLAGCTDTTCPPIQMSLTQDDLNIPRSINNAQVTIDSIQVVNANVTLTEQLDVQTEQCKINPQASIPQLRINGINSTNASIDVKIKFTNVKIHYPCFEVQISCFGPICWPSGIKTSCDEPGFDHYAQYSITGYKQSVLRNIGTNPVQWRLGPTFSDGITHVNIDNYIKTNQVKTQYADTLYSILTDKTNIARNLLETKVGAYLNQQNNADPHFEQANCFESGAPTGTINSFSNGDIISEIGGTFADGSAIPENTTASWQSNRDGNYEFRVNTINNDCTSGSVISGAAYSGAVAKNILNSTTLYAWQLPANGSNGIGLCIKDKWNGEVGLTNVLLRKVWLDQVCVIQPVSVYVCHDVSVQVCNNVQVGSHEAPGCWVYWPWGGSNCACPPGHCYVSDYQYQCGYVTQQQCGYETQNNTVCTPQLRY
jgi:hypothetical protein